ncbi:MAG TPA: single-stranded-DNA-specific exonuclease RecJ, partial [Polyangiaceae bacterium]
RLYDALALSSHAVERFGGHQAAAGVEVELARLGEFREAFEAAVNQLAAGAPALPPQTAESVWLAKDDEPARVLGDLALLEPCGLTNPAPQLLVDGQVVSAREVTGGHLKLELGLDSGHRLSAFAPTLGARAATLSGRVVVAGRLRPDRYRGQGAVELYLETIVDPAQ